MVGMSKAKAENRPLPKRFYTEVSIARGDEGWRILLDGRAVRTPARSVLIAPVEALAQAMADEWAAQDKHINPFAMPLTRLAHVAIDRIANVRVEAAREIAKYASTDTLCHRAEESALSVQQAQVWDPLLDWAAQALDAPLYRAETLLPLEQPEASIKALEARALALDDWRLTGLASAVPLLGSAVLGFALLEGETSGEDAFAASRLEEAHQNQRWGEDAEAVLARENARRDLLAVEHLFRALDGADV